MFLEFILFLVFHCLKVNFSSPVYITPEEFGKAALISSVRLSSVHTNRKLAANRRNLKTPALCLSRDRNVLKTKLFKNDEAHEFSSNFYGIVWTENTSSVFRVKLTQRIVDQPLSPGQTIATSLRNIWQPCSVQHVVYVWPPCWDVLRQVGCGWLKFENGQIFHATFVDVV